MQTEEIIRKIKGMQSLLMKKQSAKYVHILIVWYRRASGITYPIVEETPWPITYVNSTWMNEFIRFLRKCSIQLKLQKKNIQKKQRHNNRFTMHDMLSMTSSTTMLEGMNTCRMYLQVTFLSDLTNNAGTRISLSTFDENKWYRKRSNI